MASTKKARKRSPHPGVIIHERTLPSGKKAYRARFTDPETGRTKDMTLDPVALPSHQARRQWGIRKSKQLAQRKMELELGARAITRTPVDEALRDYYRRKKVILVPTTIRTYQLTTERFEDWAEKCGLKHIELLTKRHLNDLRDSFIVGKRMTPVRKGERGKWRDSGQRRSERAINRDLRTMKAVLNDWRRRELLPHLDRDAISDCLKLLKQPKEKPTFLSPAKCRKLLEAALRHDAETFELTRAEHDGLREAGSTPRYAPIAPFVAHVLLTGCRLGEAERLRWDYVDLSTKDYDGNKQGEINLPATIIKTRMARTIYLDVCPTLRQLLASLKLRAGDAPYVFGGHAPLSRNSVAAVLRRLIDKYGAPKFSWQELRRTTGTYLTNAPGIFAGASVYRSAAQLGHDVAVAEKHYLGVTRDIPRKARTLEAAMQIEDVMDTVIERASGPLQRSLRVGGL